MTSNYSRFGFNHRLVSVVFAVDWGKCFSKHLSFLLPVIILPLLYTQRSSGAGTVGPFEATETQLYSTAAANQTNDLEQFHLVLL
jgi:hypothetical protein